MVGKVLIEWLEPEDWLGKRQKYPQRMIHGEIKIGADVLVTYRKRKWRVWIVNDGRMSGQPPSSAKAAASSSVHKELTLWEELRQDRKIVKKVNDRLEELDSSYEPDSEEEEEEGGGKKEEGGGEGGTEEGGGEEEEEGGGEGGNECEMDDGMVAESSHGSGTRWRKRREKEAEGQKSAHVGQRIHQPPFWCDYGRQTGAAVA
ncbi:MAG: hypothetical protein GY816_20835 [Cytophagales bacterium]|nr:hypothetical protein [Cytophagales bacterium]